MFFFPLLLLLLFSFRPPSLPTASAAMPCSLTRSHSLPLGRTYKSNRTHRSPCFPRDPVVTAELFYDKNNITLLSRVLPAGEGLTFSSLYTSRCRFVSQKCRYTLYTRLRDDGHYNTTSEMRGDDERVFRGIYVAGKKSSHPRSVAAAYSTKKPVCRPKKNTAL